MQPVDDTAIPLERLARNIPSVVFHAQVYLDGQVRLPFVCHEAENLLGLKPRQIEHDPARLLDLVLDEDKDEFRKVMQNARDMKSKATCEIRIRRPDDSQRWIRIEAKPKEMADRKGRKRHDWFGIVMDVTEAREREFSLRKTTGLLEGILESVQDAIFVVHPPDRRILKANPAAKQIFGYRPSEVEGRSTEMLYESREAFEAFGRRSEKVLATGRSYRGEFQMRRRNGDIFPTEHTITALHAEGEWRGGVVSVVRDVSRQKEAERALKDSEEKYRSLLEHANESAVVVLNDNIAYANPQTSELVELAAEAFIDQPYRRFVHPDDLAFVESLIRRLTSGDEIPKDFEFRVVSDKGNIHWVRGNAVALEWDNQPAVMTLLTDISIQKQMLEANQEMQKRLQQAQKMEAIGNLAGGIAHDFNNVLFPIVGLAEMLMEDLPEGSLPYDHAQEIFDAGKRGGELVKQILAFSRQSEVQKLPVYLQKVLKEVIKLGRSTIPSDIEVRERIQADCSAVLADPTQIHQIVMNLITNAYHAIEPHHGTITVSLQETELEKGDWPGSRLEPGSYAVLGIADTGAGIDPGIQDRIFDPYFTTKDKTKGTGLGLAMVYGIVKEHHGEIRVSSELGKGATFEIYLPLLDKSSLEQRAPRPAVFPGGEEHILLVDDDQAIVRMETRMLETLGYRITSRLNSIEALEVFKANQDDFDLVITDMTMPKMTGDQLARELIAVRPDIPIVLCTGFSERVNREKAEIAGIKGFLMKPVLKSDLAKMVRKVLDDL